MCIYTVLIDSQLYIIIVHTSNFLPRLAGCITVLMISICINANDYAFMYKINVLELIVSSTYIHSSNLYVPYS